MKGDMAGGAAVLGAMSALRALGCPHIGPRRHLRGREHDLRRGVPARRHPDRHERRHDGNPLDRCRGPPGARRRPRLHRPPGCAGDDRPGDADRRDRGCARGRNRRPLLPTTTHLSDRLLAASDEAGERDVADAADRGAERPDQGRDRRHQEHRRPRRRRDHCRALHQHFSRRVCPGHTSTSPAATAPTKPAPYTPKGATGWGVRTLLEYALADDRA